MRQKSVISSKQLIYEPILGKRMGAAGWNCLDVYGEQRCEETNTRLLWWQQLQLN